MKYIYTAKIEGYSNACVIVETDSPYEPSGFLEALEKLKEQNLGEGARHITGISFSGELRG